MDIWTTPVGDRVDLGAGVDLVVTDRRDDPGGVSVRLRGEGSAGQVVADLRRSPVRPAVFDGYLVHALPVGEKLVATFAVTPEMVTHHIPNAPAVLMTPVLVGLIEETAARIVRPRLAPGAVAVGTFIGVRHTGAARLGEQVEVTTEITERSGHRIHYAVAATVDTRPIAHGHITFTLIAP